MRVVEVLKTQMFQKKKYKFNPVTLAYELQKTPLKAYFSRGFFLFLCSGLAAVGYFWCYNQYFGLETPKALNMKRQNAELLARFDLLNQQIEEGNRRLYHLQMRDNNVYRPIFGMEGISDEERNAGFGGVDRYTHLEYSKNGRFLTDIALRFDQLYKKTYIQSRSFDDVGRLAEQTDQMAACTPAILPVNLSEGDMWISSSFGYRPDPVYGDTRMHWGIDISGPLGSAIYATANGTVVKRGFEYFGYGNYIIIDHGFGIKTRYAHMKSVMAMEGQKVSRGECVGLLGNTGKSTGPHIHYEVIVKDRPVNPYNYFSSDIRSDEYGAMVGTARGY